MHRLTVLQLGMGWFPEQPGGLNRVYYDLLHSLPLVGVECKGVITGQSPIDGPLGETIKVAAPLNGNLADRCLSLRRVTREILDQDSIQLVAIHFALYGILAVKSIPPRPMVMHFHGPWALESKVEGASPMTVRLKHWVERYVYRRASRYVVLSSAFRKVLSQSYGIDETKIRIVPGQVDTERFNTLASRTEARRKLGWPLDRPIVVSVRRLVGRMGLEELVTAVRLIRNDHPDVLLHIAGKGPLAHELQKRIDGEGLTEFVRLLGYVSESELPTIYRAADFSIVPTSSLEGFGLIAAESLASGTPVLVTPVGGLPEVVADLAPALVMSSPQAGDIADSLGAALSGRLSVPTEEQCRTYAVAKFDRRTVAGQIKQVYEEAIATA